MHEKIKQFFDEFGTEEYNKGDVIIFANMNLKSVYYIVAGSVVQYDIAERGTRAILNTFKPGAFFPMSNAINATDTPYFYEASDQVKVKKAPAARVVEFIKNNPDVTFDLLQRIYRGTDGVLERLSEIMQGDAESRVLREIDIIEKRFGYEPISGGAHQLLKKLPEMELAERTGLARETVSRAIKKLKASGRLRVQKGYFIISQSK
jgi:CRP-like cAMP-binding protein